MDLGKSWIESKPKRKRSDVIQIATFKSKNFVEQSLRIKNLFCLNKKIILSVNIVKSLINLLENANKWVLRVEERLCNQENALDMSNFSQSSKIVQRLLFELDVRFY